MVTLLGANINCKYLKTKFSRKYVKQGEAEIIWKRGDYMVEVLVIYTLS
jgi:hypothetical protein